MTLPVYRCKTDGRLIRRSDISKGVCLGHMLNYASQVSLLEWLKVKWWIFTGQL